MLSRVARWFSSCFSFLVFWSVPRARARVEPAQRFATVTSVRGRVPIHSGMTGSSRAGTARSGRCDEVARGSHETGRWSGEPRTRPLVAALARDVWVCWLLASPVISNRRCGATILSPCFPWRCYNGGSADAAPHRHGGRWSLPVCPPVAAPVRTPRCAAIAVAGASPSSSLPISTCFVCYDIHGVQSSRSMGNSGTIETPLGHFFCPHTVFKAVWETLGPLKLPWVTSFAPTRCSKQYGKL